MHEVKGSLLNCVPKTGESKVSDPLPTPRPAPYLGARALVAGAVCAQSHGGAAFVRPRGPVSPRRPPPPGAEAGVGPAVRRADPPGRAPTPCGRGGGSGGRTPRAEPHLEGSPRQGRGLHLCTPRLPGGGGATPAGLPVGSRAGSDLPPPRGLGGVQGGP